MNTNLSELLSIGSDVSALGPIVIFFVYYETYKPLIGKSKNWTEKGSWSFYLLANKYKSIIFQLKHCADQVFKHRCQNPGFAGLIPGSTLVV